MRKVSFIDTTLRDAQQSLWSTRMTTAMMLPVAPILDRLGFEAIDLVGGAVFDVCVRYLLEDPWERMRIMSRAVTRTPLVVMTRGQSLFTFEFFPDDVVALTAKRIAANGIRYTTPYDGLNDLRNLGASQPPTECTARSLRRMGFEISLDVDGLRPVADHFAYVARREGKPLGKIAEYDPFHYEHQIPGGMISNLRSQLRGIGLEHRLEEILEESARVREELGYPIMVSPFSQFVVTQAVLNVVQGERYATVPDEVRRYALGYYGRLAAPVEPNVTDRIIGNEEPVTARPGELLAPALERVRRERGPFASDDDLRLAVFYNPEQYTRLVAARPIDVRYPVGRAPLMTLIQELAARKDIASVRLIKKRPVRAGSGPRSSLPQSAPLPE